ncbi:hypothetical protein [Methylomonas albis]|uniref:PEP-CTERM sorting domain-containing protein n=1 Tax=Methylomonas albis TaxID=1854563 RepID=A0ABR9CZK6_9GAMM|nr:hypothetical protein [Methylomonas albis]MBD9356293.1 hypothetical protein [Methylomonas albis]
MNKFILVGFICFLILGPNRLTQAATYNLISDFEFPEQNGPFLYGYAETATSAFQVLDQPMSSLEGFTGVNGWISSNYVNREPFPQVSVNSTDATYYAGTHYLAPPHAVYMHPGGYFSSNDFAILRFVAPAEGSYRVKGEFFSVDFGTKSVGVKLNSSNGNFSTDAILGAYAGYLNGIPFRFDFTRDLHEGDTLDFSVGRYDGDPTGDPVGLRGVISTVPLTPSAGLFLLGFALINAANLRGRVRPWGTTDII